jgi:hypothetical protein
VSKRRFRAPHREPGIPSYPTLESFDQSGRREFLARLGGALLGAGALASGLAACGDGRAVRGQPDQGVMMGEPVPPDARADLKPPEPDGEILSGGAPQMPAEPDLGPRWGVDGDVDQPDAQIDDSGFWAGSKPGPGAELDGGSCPNP